MGIRVGIDLGTTFCAVARIDPITGKSQVIKNSFGDSTTPSVLCFRENGEVLFGEDAKSYQESGDLNCVSFFKRSMGFDYFSVDILGKNYNATDLSAILLSKLKQEAEEQCGETIDSAVITVPAYFTHKERTATIEAGKRAGLDVIAIINEPTAAAFAYGLNKNENEQTVMIYALGGGTFDVTIARINKDEIRIIGCDGNHELGGKDWDDCIARYLAEAFYDKYEIDFTSDPEMLASMLVKAELVKKQLTSKDIVSVPIVFGGVKDSIEITQSKFEDISRPLIAMTTEVIDRLMDSVNMTWADIDGVILVGGSTRMRMVHGFVERMCGKPPLGGINVDEAVALGAAIRANITDKGQVVAALSGAGPTLSIAGAKAVTDVTAHAMGMIAESANREAYINSTIIPKNASIPAKETKSYNFRVKGKDDVLEVYVLQGGNIRPLDNTVVHKYVITGMERIGSGRTQIDVTFRYNINGVVEVSAVQSETGKTLPIRIEPVPEDMSWTDLSPKDVVGEAKLPEVEVMLAIDLSGSMNGTPTEKAIKAMLDFVDQMDNNFVKIGLAAFADKSKVLLTPTKDYRRVRHAVSGLGNVDVGYCNREHPFRDLRSVFGRCDIKYIVVLTDGCWSCNDSAIAESRRCQRNGIEVMALGFGSANHKFLKQIASTDDFASLTNLSDLGGSFSKIAQVIGSGIVSL